MSVREIEEIQHRALAEPDVIALNEFENAIKAETDPDEAPAPVELTRAQVHNLEPQIVVREFWMRDADRRVAGSGYTYWWDTPENRQIAKIHVAVRAEFRRRGIATRLLEPVLAAVKGDGRTIVTWHTIDRVPAGEALSRHIGGEIGQHVHRNRLMLADVDRGLVRSWIDDGPVRAAGYSLVFHDGPLPDELVEEAVAVYDVMNTAPRDDMAWEDRKMTVEHMRAMEKAGVAAGTTRWMLFARDDATGRFVGFTELFWHPSNPKTVQQGNTGVHQDHRGHALGKWLKADMLERVFERWPDAVDVQTGNADSNDAMLGINRALGFTPYSAVVNWQARVERVEEYLAGR